MTACGSSCPRTFASYLMMPFLEVRAKREAEETCAEAIWWNDEVEDRDREGEGLWARMMRLKGEVGIWWKRERG